MTRTHMRRSTLRVSILAIGLVALLGGCVVYPIGYGGGGPHYWHGRGWR